MKNIFIYLEGPSDKLGLERLLENLIHTSALKGHRIGFHFLGGKIPLLNKGPVKALNTLRNTPNSHAFLLPDLYPKNTPFPHTTFDELEKEMRRRFASEVKTRNCDQRLIDRFHIHCFKYDMEVMLLASSEAMMKRLEIT